MSYLWKTNKDLQRAFQLHLVASSPPPICSLFSPWPVLIWIKHYIRIFQAQHKHKYPVYCLLTPRPADAGVVVFPAASSAVDKTKMNVRNIMLNMLTHRALVVTSPRPPRGLWWVIGSRGDSGQVYTGYTMRNAASTDTGDIRDAKRQDCAQPTLYHSGNETRELVCSKGFWSYKVKTVKNTWYRKLINDYLSLFNETLKHCQSW